MDRPLRIAVIATVWYPLSHADVIVTRWVAPYVTDERYGWTKPASSIASVFIEQFPANDIGRAFCEANELPIFASIEEALTMGTGEIAVDAVLLIAEHGVYPENRYLQKLYPRKRMLDAIAAAFRQYGRSVPVFNDKHLSWSFEESAAMLQTAKELGFPLYAGSSLTHCLSEPAVPVSAGDEVTEVVALFAEHPEHYGYHMMEVVQAHVEKRKGGETGVRAVRSYRDKGVKEALERGEFSRDLLQQALQQAGFPASEGLAEFLVERSEVAWLLQVEYRDGLRASYFNLPRFTRGWTTAVRRADGVVKSCGVEEAGLYSFFANFARLNHVVEVFFQTGEAPNSILRTHLVAGMLEAALQAAFDAEGTWVETPQLALCY